MKEFIRKYGKGLITAIICVLVINLVDVKFFNAEFNPWEALRTIVIVIVVTIVLQKNK